MAYLVCCCLLHNEPACDNNKEMQNWAVRCCVVEYYKDAGSPCEFIRTDKHGTAQLKQKNVEFFGNVFSAHIAHIFAG